MVLEIKKIKGLAAVACLAVILLLVAWYMWPASVKKEMEDKPVTANTKETEFKVDRADEQGVGFLARCRLERERARSREISILNGVMDKSGDTRARQAAALRLVEIGRDIDKETKAENLVRCRGVEDCVAIVQPGSVTIVIPAGKQDRMEDNDLKGILSQTLGYEEEQICFVYHSP